MYYTYLATFAACINPIVLVKLLNKVLKIRLHHNQLPAEPKRWKDLNRHPFGAEFKRASRVEIDSVIQRGCFGQAVKLSKLADNTKVLPLI